MPRHRPVAAIAVALPLLLLAAGPALADSVVKAAWIDPFSSWAGPGGGWLYARIHKGLPLPKPKPGESKLVRVKETIETLELNALKRGTVSITGVPGVVSAVADDHGFLKIRLPAGMRPGILRVTLKVATPGYGGPAATLPVQIFSDGGIGVLSDIDDTLLNSGVTNKLRLLANTLFRSTWELKTFPGAMQALNFVAGKNGTFSARSFFMLSGSPWALQTRIEDFFDRQGLARGAMILRRYSQESLNSYDYKLPHRREVVAAFPRTKWILLGDSAEKDPEVYAQIRREWPRNIERIYIHVVTRESLTASRFKDMSAFKSWNDVLADARTRGYGVPATVIRSTASR